MPTLCVLLPTRGRGWNIKSGITRQLVCPQELPAYPAPPLPVPPHSICVFAGQVFRCTILNAEKCCDVRSRQLIRRASMVAAGGGGGREESLRAVCCARPRFIPANGSLRCINCKRAAQKINRSLNPQFRRAAVEEMNDYNHPEREREVRHVFFSFYFLFPSGITRKLFTTR